LPDSILLDANKSMKVIKKIKQTKPIVIFYFLVIYVFASSIWWMYLLINKNQKLYDEKIANFHLQYETPQSNFEQIPAIQEFKKNKERQNFMILSEGLVFMILLALGSLTIRSYINKEIALNRQQRNFLLSITHELRSPLTGIQISIETIKDRLLDKDKQTRLLNNALQDVNRLKELVDNMLMAAKIEQQALQFTKHPVHISDLLKSLKHRYTAINRNRRNFEFKVESELIVRGDLMAFTSVLTNLLDNAVKYSPSQSTIFIDAFKKLEEIQILIRDEGIGIPKEEQPKIFDKFYRIGSEDTRKSKGTGLGLFIVKELVEMNKGKISYEANSPKGSIFKMIFPKYTDSTYPEITMKPSVQTS